jgi:tetratricopeptide (TPR) repeat protein/predicted Ser/Thr protein kinase
VDAVFPAPDPGFALGTRLGRYELVSQVGVGGMGVVFEARDPELDRTVAVKVFSGKGESSEEGHARLRREGQIMARLTHPNVLRVYDVGVAQGFVFVAMEFVAGGTLRDWLKRKQRSPEEILAIFTQAGRGLAAAHDAGLVHRDFKPSNVLVGDDGRVLVMDFGLARPADGTADVTASSPSTPPTSPMITRAGQRVGTPAFMAPEQHDDAPIDARADQFSFCVALWRALYETAPYAGLTVEMILAAARRGELAEPAPTAAARVPSRVRPVLERGLRASPAERFASMRELLDALAPRPSRGRAWIGAAGGVLALAAAVIAWATLGRGASVASDPCAAAVDRFAGVWDDEAAAAVKQAFVATGQPFAEKVFAEVARQLDGRRRAFATMRRESCEATLVRREQSDTMMDLRTACLDRQQQEVSSLVTALRRADAEAFRRAPSAAATAGDPAHCADTAALARRVPLPADPARRAAIAAVERDIAAARAAIAAGRGRAAIDETERVIAAARAVDHAPTLAYALYAAAILHAEIEDAARAEALFREALLAGDAGGDDNLRFECEARLVSLVGYQLERRDDANRHAEQAAALLARLGPDPSRTALLAKHHAISEWWNGRYDDAKRLARQSVTEYEKVDPAGSGWPRRCTTWRSRRTMRRSTPTRWRPRSAPWPSPSARWGPSTRSSPGRRWPPPARCGDSVGSTSHAA